MEIRSEEPELVVLDPGHGGSAPAGRSSPRGVVGPSGASEKDVTLALARLVGERVADFAAVRLTRDGDRNRSLADRARDGRGAAAFVSLHAGGGPPAGADVWAHERAAEPSLDLARELRWALGPREAASPLLAGRLAVLDPDALLEGTAACLVDVDRMDDPAAARRLADPAALAALADSLASGLAVFLANRIRARGSYRGGLARAYGRVRGLLSFGVLGGMVVEPFYRNPTERDLVGGRRETRTRNLGVDVSLAGSPGLGAHDVRRGLEVYATPRETLALGDLARVRAFDRASATESIGVGLEAEGDAALTGATVRLQPRKPEGDDEYGGIAALAYHYRVPAEAEGEERSFTLYTEYLNLITPEFPPKAGDGTPIPSADWERTGKGTGFGPALAEGAALTTEQLTAMTPVLVGYLGATPTPLVHVRCSFARGRTAEAPSLLIDPTAVLG
ncbi:MAG: N-acetylmuramoyl-L-alanine amidase [Planctomycetota bacterium]